MDEQQREQTTKLYAKRVDFSDHAKPCHGDSQYEELKRALMDYYQPENPVEQVLVERIAVLDWRLRRNLMAERKSVHAMPGEEKFLPPPEAMERILRYDRTADRELHRAITALERIRSKKNKNGASETSKNADSRSKGTEPDASVDPNKGSHDLKKGSHDPQKESYDPSIGTTSEVALETLFSSSVRVKLLKLFLLEPEGRFYIREISARTGAWLGPVQRETAKLSDAGILIKEISGRQTYYRINQACPFVPGLRSIFALFMKDYQPNSGNTPI